MPSAQTPLTATDTRCLRVLDLRTPLVNRSPDILTEVRFDARNKLRACIGVVNRFRDEDVAGLAIQVCRTSPDSRWVDAAQAVPFTEFRNLVVDQWVFPRVRRGSLRSCFQPIVECRGGECAGVHGHECLIRCPIGPYTVPANELFGLAWNDSLRRELHLAAFWTCLRASEQCPRDQRLFVNVDPQYLPNDRPFWNRVANLLDENQFAASRVVLEFIESPARRDLRKMEDFAQSARALGMRIAIDDMGAQQDPLTLFRRLQPDVIKLEAELVRDCTTDRWRRGVCEHLIALARDVGISCVLEGIEAEHDLRWALRQSVPLLQGYRFGRPGPRMKTSAELPPDSLRRPHFHGSVLSLSGLGLPSLEMTSGI